MSQQNIELVQAALAAYFRSDEQALRELAEPGVTITTRRDQPDHREHHGVDGLIAYLGEWADAWEEYSFDVLRMRDSGDSVLMTARQRGKGKRSGVPIDGEVTFAFTLRDGRIARVQMFGGEEEALGALGEGD
jgi:ketosteroid isomerase-like protein